VAHCSASTVSRDLQGATIEILPGVEVLGQIDIRAFDASSVVDTAKLKVGLRGRKGEPVSPPPVSVETRRLIRHTGCGRDGVPNSWSLGCPTTLMFESAKV